MRTFPQWGRASRDRNLLSEVAHCGPTEADSMQNSPALPDTGFLRLRQIIGDTKRATPAVIPVSRSTWWAGVRSGRYPKPVKLGERCTAWRVEDVRALIEAAA